MNSILNIHRPRYPISVFLALFLIPYFYPQTYFVYARVATTSEHLLTTLCLFAIVLCAAAAGTGIGSRERQGQGVPTGHLAFIRNWSRFFIVLAIFMNAAIVIVTVREIQDHLTSGRGALDRFAGLNIVSQFYLLFLGPFIWASLALGYRYKRVLLVLGVLLLLRSVFRAERLALIEFLVPCLVLLSMFGVFRVSVRTAVLGLALFLIAWIGMEATRSFYVIHFLSDPGREVSFGYTLSWTTERLMAYYGDAINKTHYVLQNGNFFVTDTYLNIINRLAERAFGVEKSSGLGMFDALSFGGGRYKDFTNPGGVTMLLSDFGPLAAVFLFLIIAVFVVLHRAAMQRKLFALGLYPIMYVAVMELPRVSYLTNQRFSFAMLAFLIFWVVYKGLAVPEMASTGRNRQQPNGRRPTGSGSTPGRSGPRAV